MLATCPRYKISRRSFPLSFTSTSQWRAALLVSTDSATNDRTCRLSGGNLGTIMPAPKAPGGNDKPIRWFTWGRSFVSLNRAIERWPIQQRFLAIASEANICAIEIAVGYLLRPNVSDTDRNRMMNAVLIDLNVIKWLTVAGDNAQRVCIIGGQYACYKWILAYGVHCGSTRHEIA